MLPYLHTPKVGNLAVFPRFTDCLMKCSKLGDHNKANKLPWFSTLLNFYLFCTVFIFGMCIVKMCIFPFKKELT